MVARSTAEVARFSPTGRIVAFGGAGDDDIQVAGNISLPAWLYGEAGNDRLKGGASNDVLLGGAGDDFLAGDSGRDLLIGGTGADRILGNAGDDILIAGTTDFDANEAALALIMQEWTRIDATFATACQPSANRRRIERGLFADRRHGPRRPHRGRAHRRRRQRLVPVQQRRRRRRQGQGDRSVHVRVTLLRGHRLVEPLSEQKGAAARGPSCFTGPITSGKPPPRDPEPG